MINKELEHKHLRYWEDSCALSQFHEWCGKSEPWKEELAQLIVDVDFKSVLDVGCGVGVMKEILDANEYPSDYYYVGTEITPQFIEECRSKDIPTLPVDLRDMSVFKDKEFDCVLCLDVLNHQLEDPHVLLEEVIRVTKKLAVVSFFRAFRPPTSRTLAAWNLDLTHKEVHIQRKHNNLIYAEYSIEYLEKYLNSLDMSGITYQWATRTTTPGKHPKPSTLMIMRD